MIWHHISNSAWTLEPSKLKKPWVTGLGGEGCLWRTSFPISMNHMDNHPKYILSGEVTQTPILGPNGILVLWVHAPGMPLNKCPQKALSQYFNLWQLTEEHSCDLSTGRKCHLHQLSWTSALATNWWPCLQIIFKHLSHSFPNYRYVHVVFLQKNKYSMVPIIYRIKTKLLNLQFWAI